MKKIVPLLFASLLALPSFAQKASPFTFGKDVHTVGNLEQGQKTHVVLHAKNTSLAPWPWKMSSARTAARRISASPSL